MSYRPSSAAPDDRPLSSHATENGFAIPSEALTVKCCEFTPVV